MLLLRRFGALTKSLAGGGQDQLKTTSLIGAALREGIHAHLQYDQENGSAISNLSLNSSYESGNNLTLAQDLDTTQVR